MLLSAVSFFFSKPILTNNDGHFECFSLKNVNIRTYLEPSCAALPLGDYGFGHDPGGWMLNYLFR